MSSLTPLLTLILLSIVVGSDGCTPTGVCGTNPYCGGGGGGYYQHPHVAGVRMYACPPGGCGPGYTCGPYGCYRQRVFSANSMRLQHSKKTAGALKAELLNEFANRTQDAHDEEEDKGRGEMISESDPELQAAAPSVAAFRRRDGSGEDPNRIFGECCLDRKLPDACLQKCHYAQYTREALTRMYLRGDACPMEAIRELQFCAAQGQNHVACCQRNGITQTLAGEKCLVFCDQRAGRVTMLDLTYLPCFERFDDMKACFWDEASRLFASRRRA